MELKNYTTKELLEELKSRKDSSSKTFAVNQLRSEICCDGAGRKFNAIEGFIDSAEKGKGYIFDLDIRENGEANKLEQFSDAKEIIFTLI